MFSSISRVVLFTALFLTIASFFLSACSIVGPGERGVRVSTGTVSEDVKGPGLYFWFPYLAGMKTLNVQIQKSEIKATAGSFDMQDVHTTLAVNWAINAANVVTTYKDIGDEDAVETNILIPAVQEVMKAATSKYTAEETLTKRLQLKKDIDEGLKLRLEAHGITFYEVSIVDLSFSHDFANAIEQKQVAEQSAKKAGYVALQATQEAKALVEQAKGQAEAQRLLKSTITSELLQKAAIEKWNGQFPQVMGGTGTLPFINLKLGGGN